MYLNLVIALTVFASIANTAALNAMLDNQQSSYEKAMRELVKQQEKYYAQKKKKNPEVQQRRVAAERLAIQEKLQETLKAKKKATSEETVLHKQSLPTITDKEVSLPPAQTPTTCVTKPRSLSWEEKKLHTKLQSVIENITRSSSPLLYGQTSLFTLSDLPKTVPYKLAATIVEPHENKTIFFDQRNQDTNIPQLIITHCTPYSFVTALVVKIFSKKLPALRTPDKSMVTLHHFLFANPLAESPTSSTRDEEILLKETKITPNPFTCMQKCIDAHSLSKTNREAHDAETCTLEFHVNLPYQRRNSFEQTSVESNPSSWPAFQECITRLQKTLEVNTVDTSYYISNDGDAFFGFVVNQDGIKKHTQVH